MENKLIKKRKFYSNELLDWSPTEFIIKSNIIKVSDKSLIEIFPEHMVRNITTKCVIYSVCNISKQENILFSFEELTNHLEKNKYIYLNLIRERIQLESPSKYLVILSKVNKDFKNGFKDLMCKSSIFLILGVFIEQDFKTKKFYLNDEGMKLKRYITEKNILI